MKENVKNVSEKQEENMRLNSVDLEKMTSLQIVYVTGDFNWLKTCELRVNKN